MKLQLTVFLAAVVGQAAAQLPTLTTLLTSTLTTATTTSTPSVHWPPRISCCCCHPDRRPLQPTKPGLDAPAKKDLAMVCPMESTIACGSAGAYDEARCRNIMCIM